MTEEQKKPKPYTETVLCSYCKRKVWKDEMSRHMKEHFGYNSPDEQVNI